MQFNYSKLSGCLFGMASDADAAGEKKGKHQGYY